MMESSEIQTPDMTYDIIIVHELSLSSVSTFILSLLSYYYQLEAPLESRHRSILTNSLSLK
jgi:hypothetical protein